MRCDSGDVVEHGGCAWNLVLIAVVVAGVVCGAQLFIGELLLAGRDLHGAALAASVAISAATMAVDRAS